MNVNVNKLNEGDNIMRTLKWLIRRTILTLKGKEVCSYCDHCKNPNPEAVDPQCGLCESCWYANR